MIQFDTTEIKAVMHQLGIAEKKSIPIMKNALNRTLTVVKKEILQRVEERYVFSEKLSARVNKATRVNRASLNNLEARINVSSTATPLYKFSTDTKYPWTDFKGMYASKIDGRKPPFPKSHVLKTTSMHTIRQSFIARMGSGHLGIFERYAGKKIKEKYGPSYSAMAKMVSMVGDRKESMNEFYNDALSNELSKGIGDVLGGTP